ncbi:prolyl oligopeptidase family serine peptidase [Luteococcus sp. H138]|uniref:carboxylesterase family protein n=1 Tax=unclassified Luteococcus TaxID=2639923 RepID=UPI00313AD70F
MKKLRSLSLAMVSALALTPALTTPAQAAASTEFTLDAQVIDGGQQVVSVTLETTRYRINPRSLGVNTFRVHATGRNPYASLSPSQVMGTYDRDRTITSVSLDRDGDIVIKMVRGEDAPAAFTFGWSQEQSRNIMLDLNYSITQRLPIKLRNGRQLKLSQIKQGKLVDKEVDAFSHGATDDGLKYRLFTPHQARPKNPRPLIVWLHGGGEGGWAKAYNNDLPLIANRGALALSTAKAQKVFKGAYVAAPQADTRWLDNPTMGYAPRVKAMIDELAEQYDVDRRRIYVAGPSNGGYMTMRMVADYPKLFAANVTICPARVYQDKVMVSDADIRKMRKTPTWIVQATNDQTLPYKPNGLYTHQVLGNSTLTSYPDVAWNGHTFPGHFSWVYVARNDPANAKGQHIWQWMAQQHR